MLFRPNEPYSLLKTPGFIFIPFFEDWKEASIIANQSFLYYRYNDEIK